jgi:ribulose-phosphate 3-epimerase
MSIKIAPSILAADFSCLGDQVREAIQAGVEYIHIDIMDGHFVPNLSMGPDIVSAIKPLVRGTDVLFDVHLMIDNPDNFINAFAQAGADIITVHVETCPHLHRTIQYIRELGVKPGVTLNPATPLASLDDIITDVELILIMSVNPGFGGQSYIPASNARIQKMRQTLAERGLRHIEIEVDGGIKAENAAQAINAGANVLVSGSGIFNKKASILENVSAIRKACGS